MFHLCWLLRSTRDIQQERMPTSRARSAPGSNHDRGAALVFLVILLALIIGIAVFIINIGTSFNIQAELQNAADSAALAGTSRFCMTEDCYTEARAAAIETLSQHQSRSGWGGVSSLRISPSNSTSTWHLEGTNNLLVTIERGRWRPASNTFESMEGAWQNLHPGVPGMLVANAVRITISRPQTKIMNALLGPQQFEIAARAVATTVDDSTINVAPFAIPVCSLLDHQGHYSADSSNAEICSGDRLFAATNRYGAGAGSTVLPSFPYYPCSSSTIIGTMRCISPSYAEAKDEGNNNCSTFWLYWFMSEDQVTFNPPLDQPLARVPAAFQQGQYCLTRHGSIFLSGTYPDFYEVQGWNGDYRYSDINNHYGIVGLPGAVPENQIQSRIKSNLVSSYPAAWSTSIGAQFSPLTAGLTEACGNPASANCLDTVIWEAIKSKGAGGTHIPASQSIVGAMDRNLYFFLAEDDMTFYTYPDPRVFFPDGNSRGVCNSRRGLFSKPTVPLPYDEYGNKLIAARFDLLPAVGYPATGGNQSHDSNVWRISIPVVADENGRAGSCRGMLGSSDDPELRAVPTDGHTPDYQVEGFVTAEIFDVDVGRTPPTLSSYTPTGYGFKQNCNLVRARIDCGRPFITSSNQSRIAPRIIAR